MGYDSVKAKEYREANKEKLREQRRQSYLRNIDHIKEHTANYYEENKEKVKERQRASRHKDYDATRQREREYAKQNGHKWRETANKWLEARPGYHNEASRKSYHADPRRRMYNSAKFRAKKNGIPFTITLDDIVVPEVCPAFGTPFEFGEGRGQGVNSPSLDRVDPSKGYEPGNVCVISWLANRLKNEATLPQLRQLCAYVEAHLA